MQVMTSGARRRRKPASRSKARKPSGRTPARPRPKIIGPWYRRPWLMPTVSILSLLTALVAILISTGVLSPISGPVRDAFRGGSYWEQRIVSEYLALTRKAFPWQQFSLYESSEAYFRSHFAQLDPTRSHPFRNVGPQQQIDIPTLTQVKAGAGVITVRGRAATPSLVTNEWLPDTASTAYQLTDRRAENTLVLCRVPLDANEPLPADQGQVILAQGLVLGAGISPGLGQRGPIGVIYMACSSVAPGR